MSFLSAVDQATSITTKMAQQQYLSALITNSTAEVIDFRQFNSGC
jgi:hypothetical protein